MAIELVAGQTIANDFTLLHQIDSPSETQLWLAVQESTQERVQLEVLTQSIDVARAQQSLDQYKALIHPNILPIYRIVEHDGATCLISGYRRNLQPIDLTKPLNLIWPELKTIVLALDYAHSLGFVHGRLTPSCCAIGEDGQTYLSGFGRPSGNLGRYVSADQTPSPQSDLFSVAQILFTCLTGAPLAKQDEAIAASIDPDLVNLLRSMLAPEPTDRPKDFSTLIELLDSQAEKAHVQPSEFSRPEPTTFTPASTTSSESSQHRLPRERTVVSTPVALAALAVIIVFAGLLFVFLPETEIKPSSVTQATPSGAEAPAETNSQTPEPQAPALTPLELAKIEALKAQGVELAALLLRRQVEVEDIGGRLWAGERYDESTNLGIAGDEAYREEQFQLAVDQYNAGIALLDEIIAEADDVFASTIAEGEQALLAGDYETALNAYQILTRIEPEDPALARAKARAENLEQVVRLSQDAAVLERNGDLGAALDKFRAANNMDKVWQPAIDGIQRINSQLARNRFQDEMSKGFAAIGRGEFEAAEAAFAAAQTILPNSKEPLDGLQQIELAKTQAEINRLNTQIAAAEDKGEWKQAISLYEELLEVSPGLGTAVNGLASAKTQAELNDELNKYIENPHLMVVDEELQSARAALVQASTSPHFKEEARTLSHLVSLARLEIQVRLRSDQRTDVTVYQVGQYGKIDETQIALYPGIYTFVGKRQGYRDVYKEVHIKGDVNPVTVDVICSERI